MTDERFEQIKVVYAEWCMLHPGEWDICTAPSQEWEQFYRSRGVTWEEMDMCEFDLCDTDMKDPEYARRKAEERGLMADNVPPMLRQCSADVERSDPNHKDEDRRTATRHLPNISATSAERTLADIVYDIKGAAFESHKWYKAGCNERIYEVGVLCELRQKGYDAVRQEPLPVYYKGEPTDVTLRMDIFVRDTAVGNIILELKALESYGDKERMQLFSYMRQTNTRYGMLINFHDKVFTEVWEYDACTNKCQRL